MGTVSGLGPSKRCREGLELANEPGDAWVGQQEPDREELELAKDAGDGVDTVVVVAEGDVVASAIDDVVEGIEVEDAFEDDVDQLPSSVDQIDQLSGPLLLPLVAELWAMRPRKALRAPTSACWRRLATVHGKMLVSPARSSDEA